MKISFYVSSCIPHILLHIMTEVFKSALVIRVTVTMKVTHSFQQSCTVPTRTVQTSINIIQSKKQCNTIFLPYVCDSHTFLPLIKFFTVSTITNRRVE